MRQYICSVLLYRDEAEGFRHECSLVEVLATRASVPRHEREIARQMLRTLRAPESLLRPIISVHVLANDCRLPWGVCRASCDWPICFFGRFPIFFSGRFQASPFPFITRHVDYFRRFAGRRLGRRRRRGRRGRRFADCRIHLLENVPADCRIHLLENVSA